MQANDFASGLMEGDEGASVIVENSRFEGDSEFTVSAILCQVFSVRFTAD